MERRRQRLKPEIEALISMLHSEGKKPPAILTEISRRFGGQQVTLRSIQRKVATLRGNPSTPWRITDAASPQEAEIMRTFLIELAERMQGQVVSVSLAEAGLIVKLRTAAPDIPAWTALRLANLYLADRDVDALDGFVIYAPWRDPQPYWTAIEQQWVPRLPAGIVALLVATWTEGYGAFLQDDDLLRKYEPEIFDHAVELDLHEEETP